MIHHHGALLDTSEGRWPYSASREHAIAVDLATASPHGADHRSACGAQPAGREIVSECREDAPSAMRATRHGDRAGRGLHARDAARIHTVHDSSGVVQRDLAPIGSCEWRTWTHVAAEEHQREQPTWSRSDRSRTRRTNSRRAVGESSIVAPSSV